MVVWALTSKRPSLQFRKVDKVHIVRSEWEQWDVNSESPLAYPESGDPEGYILDHPHDPALSNEIGPLWKLFPEIVAGIQGDNNSFQSSRYSGGDVVRKDVDSGRTFITARIRDAFLDIAPADVAISPAVME